MFEGDSPVSEGGDVTTFGLVERRASVGGQAQRRHRSVDDLDGWTCEQRCDLGSGENVGWKVVEPPREHRSRRRRDERIVELGPPSKEMADLDRVEGEAVGDAANLGELGTGEVESALVVKHMAECSERETTEYEFTASIERK